MQVLLSRKHKSLFQFSGRTLVFIFLPQVFARIGFGKIFCILYFGMIFLFGFTSQLVMYGSVIKYLTKSFKVLKTSEKLFSVGFTLIFFLIGLCMTTPGGIYLLELMDVHSLSWNCVLAVLFMLCALAIYGKWARICVYIICTSTWTLHLHIYFCLL